MFLFSPGWGSTVVNSWTNSSSAILHCNKFHSDYETKMKITNINCLNCLNFLRSYSSCSSFICFQVQFKGLWTLEFGYLKGSLKFLRSMVLSSGLVLAEVMLSRTCGRAFSAATCQLQNSFAQEEGLLFSLQAFCPEFKNISLLGGLWIWLGGTDSCFVLNSSVFWNIVYEYSGIPFPDFILLTILNNFG